MKIEITPEVKHRAIIEFNKSFVMLTREITWMISCPIFDEQQRKDMAEDSAAFLNRFAEKCGFFEGNRSFEEQRLSDEELAGILLQKKVK